MLAEAGCMVLEIATRSGHSQAHVQKILDRYLVRTKSLAESAIATPEKQISTNCFANCSEKPMLNASYVIDLMVGARGFEPPTPSPPD
jgi:hypothetical protein